jgi:hypothetical protein
MKEGMRIRINGVPPKDDPKENSEGEGQGDSEGTGLFNDLTKKILGDSTVDTYRPDVPNLEAESPAEEEQREGKAQ